MSNTKKTVSDNKTVQNLVKESKDFLLTQKFSISVLDKLTDEQIIKAADTRRSKGEFSQTVRKVSTSKGIHVRFLNHIESVESNRLTFDEVLTWLYTDMSPDSKHWFGLPWSEVLESYQMYDLGFNPEFNIDLYVKFQTRAKQRVSTILTHDSDNNKTTNKTVNIELAKRGSNIRCQLIESVSLPVAVQLIDTVK